MADKELLERQLREREARLTALTVHPSWAELNEVFEGKKQRHLRVLAANLMGGEPVDQRQIDYHRGFWQGCTWLLKNPAQAEASLKKALADAERATAIEETHA